MYKTVSMHVDVDLDDFDDEDLIDHLESKGYTVVNDGGVASTNPYLLKEIYELRRMNKPYERELEQLIWSTIGRM